MPKQPIKLVSLAVALTALSGAAAVLPSTADAKPSNPGKSDDATGPREDVQPNVLMSVGQDLLGMIVKKGPDGFNKYLR